MQWKMWKDHSNRTLWQCAVDFGASRARELLGSLLGFQPAPTMTPPVAARQSSQKRLSEALPVCVSSVDDRLIEPIASDSILEVCQQSTAETRILLDSLIEMSTQSVSADSQMKDANKSEEVLR